MKTENAEAEVVRPEAPPRAGGHSYRDELNFAEFPLASLSDRVPQGQKTLVFTDSVFDQGRRQTVTRKLTISASDEYGLPTALDDEVILGLIQLTNKKKFADRKVHFTRYELIKLLGWDRSTDFLARNQRKVPRRPSERNRGGGERPTAEGASGAEAGRSGSKGA